MTRKEATGTFRPGQRVTEFEVDEGGTLRVANFVEAEVRADFYESVAGCWSESPAELIEAMASCLPLAWAVHSVYSDLRDELEAEWRATMGGDRTSAGRRADLKSMLDALPDEPEEGAEAWLMSLSREQFDARVVPEIDRWFNEPPDWGSEDDYLPEWSTSQGAALAFFRDMSADELDTLGVEVIEGEHPGSSYYAAELCIDIDEANLAAQAAGIPVRFVESRG